MSPTIAPWLLAASFAVSFGATRLVRRLALTRDLVDRPNERSSHEVPTPRLGGLGIMAGFLPFAAWVAANAGRELMTIVVCTAAVAALGLVDDLRPLPVRVRFVVQAIGAVVVVAVCRDGLGAAAGSLDRVLPRAVLAAGAVLWIVWATNLYNFMDGIDGLAGGQALLAAAGLGVLAWHAGAWEVALVLGLLGSAAGGFLPSNLPKASIFMGDVGSTAIGFFLASAPFAAPRGEVPLLAVALALALFVLDATSTLLRRMLRGERWSTPHRTHLYQRPLATGLSHGAVTYTAWSGMAALASMTAAYGVATPWVRVGFFAAALTLFLTATAYVRRREALILLAKAARSSAAGPSRVQ